MLNTINVNLNTDLKVSRVPELGIKIKSQDINNNLFILRFTDKGKVIELDETYTVEILTKFEKSKSHRLTSATVYRDYARWEFDTSFITQDEKVTNYVYVRKSGSLVVSADANAFAFDVGLSEIDKNAGRVAEVYDENYQKHLDEFKDNVDFEEIAQAESDRQANEDIRQANELLREENYNQKVDTAIVEADVVAKVDNKVTELTPQITNLTAQLAQKVTRNNAEITDADLSQEVKEQMTGGSVAVVGERSVNHINLHPNLSNYIIDARNQLYDIVCFGKNIFDGTFNMGFDKEYGSNNIISSSSETAYYGFVRIEKGATYTVTKYSNDIRFRVCLVHDLPTDSIVPLEILKYENADFGSKISRTVTNDVDANYLLVLTETNESRIQVEKGGESTTFEPFEQQIKSDFIELNNKALVREITGEYNPTFVGLGNANTTTGNIFASTNRCFTNIFFVEKGTRISVSDLDVRGVLVHEWEDENNFVGVLARWVRDFTIPRDMYIRLLTAHADDRDIQDVSLFDNKISLFEKTKREELEETTPYLFGTFNKLYHPSESEAGNYLITSTADDVYAKYDNEIMNVAPHFVSKNLLGYATKEDGTDDMDLPIYEYVVANSTNNTNTTRNNSQTVLIETGIHGDEKTTVLSTFNFLKELVTKWMDDDSLASLKSNLTFKVIPVANPYGFNNHTRPNARGVDINRNFSYQWESNEPLYFTKGEAPYSENESTIIRDWFADNSDALIYLDFHNFGGTERFMYVISPSEKVKNVYDSVARRLTDVIKHKYIGFDDNVMIGSETMTNSPNTSNEAYHVYGIERTAVLEIAYSIPNGTVQYEPAVIESGTYFISNLLLGLMDDYSK